jgi:secreted trypsin-like serine protease
MVRESEPAPAGFVVLVDRAASDGLFAWQFCNGVLVGPTAVLTAAHCVEGRVPDSIDVVAGVPDLCASVGQGSRSHVVGIRVHPEREQGGQAFDLAELEIDPPLHVEAIRIAAAPPDGTVGRAFSWTDASSGLPGCALRGLDFTVRDPGFCAQAIGGGFETASMLCATRSDTGTSSVCSGDSGGPIVARRGAALVVLGLVSWAWSCDGNGPEVFARAAERLQPRDAGIWP